MIIRKILPILPFVMLSTVVCTSCLQKERIMTKKEMQQAVDSAMSIQLKMLKEQAAIDLDHRMSIEMKPITDSIVDAAVKGNTNP